MDYPRAEALGVRPRGGPSSSRERVVSFMTPAEIRGREPSALPEGAATPLERARERMRAAGQWHPWQAIGRRYAIGCVALEVTQRCNLDCTPLLSLGERRGAEGHSARGGVPAHRHDPRPLRSGHRRPGHRRRPDPAPARRAGRRSCGGSPTAACARRSSPTASGVARRCSPSSPRPGSPTWPSTST